MLIDGIPVTGPNLFFTERTLLGDVGETLGMFFGIGVAGKCPRDFQMMFGRLLRDACPFFCKKKRERERV